MKKNIISHIRDIGLAMSISLSLGVIVNVLYFNFRGRYWFVFMNPLKKMSYETVDNATFSTIVYLLIGVFIWSIIWLYNTDRFGFKLPNLFHFLVSFVGFFFLYLLSYVPWGLPIKIAIIYFKTSFIPWDVVKPVLWIISSYLIIWGILWLVQYRQVRKMNMEFNK
ncbi:DUF3021 family protein [Lactococcus garvieae]|jgi:hypothetical protein|uniref:DUF3021 family protein n=1 Tax=Lactococcus garvieae TaxID=1363 RepID=UPI0009BD446D|nr:DUF3021 family protein [Lactococcus garvieae]QPS71866.1 DUF3021 family protein [Lactococcus garvieae]